jgi:hypothetical protein
MAATKGIDHYWRVILDYQKVLGEASDVLSRFRYLATLYGTEDERRELQQSVNAVCDRIQAFNDGKV